MLPRLTDPSPPNAPHIAPAAEAANASPSMFPAPSPQPRGSHHRRARSELAFFFPDDLGGGDPVAGGSADEIGSEDDLFCTFMDIEMVGCKLEPSGSWSEGGDYADRAAESSPCGDDRKVGDKAAASKSKHRHSFSVDGCSATSSTSTKREGVFAEVIEVKKAMTAEHLAELSAVDPKRAKRILANRQSAAHSKERKSRYMSELERKVQTLQTEATTLSAQLTLFQRDTTGLLAENSDLKLWLQAMEQQAHLCDTLNETLKQELHRLKVATGEISKSDEAFSDGMQNLAYNQSFFTLTQQQPIQHHQTLQLQSRFQQSQTGLSNHQMLNHPISLLDAMQQDSFGGLQGLDINKFSSNLVKSENSAISITESSSIS